LAHRNEREDNPKIHTTRIRGERDINKKIFIAAASVLGFAFAPPVVSQSTPEVEALLYRAADTLGMLRTPAEVDRLVTMIYSGTGSMLNDGRSCDLTDYRASVRYPIPGAEHPFPVPGMRVDFTCAGDGEASRRQVHVVAGELAWNEAEPGVSAMAAPEAVRERLLQLWLLPQSLIKAAAAAGPLTNASEEGGKPTLTFPLPAPLDDTIVHVTLDPAVFLHHTMPTGAQRGFSHRIELVETQFDGASIEVHYSDYADWNADDYKSDVLLPGHIRQIRDGTTTLDLTVDSSNTYNPYVIMPVPESLR
jgi:hypothetical protein